MFAGTAHQYSMVGTGDLGSGGKSIIVVFVATSAAPWWQNEAYSLHDLSAVKRTFMQQIGTFDARTHVPAVQEQHG